MKDRQRAKKEGISEAQEIERMREREESKPTTNIYTDGSGSETKRKAEKSHTLRRQKRDAHTERKEMQR